MKRRIDNLAARLLLMTTVFTTALFGVGARPAEAAVSLGWSTPEGVRVVPNATTDYNQGTQDTGRIVTTSDGGYVTIWRDYDLARLYAQKYNSSGVAQWAAAGVAFVTEASTNTISSVQGLVPDSSGGAIVQYTLFNSSNSRYEQYAQRLSSSGVLLWGSGSCIECSSAMGDPVASAISDGSGGMIVGYSAGSTGSYDIYTQRLDASGAKQWGASGTQLTTASGNQRNPVTVSDGSGGAIIGFQDEGGSSFDQRAQRVNSSGTAQWTAGGVAVVTASGGQILMTGVAHSSGGAVFAWQDPRAGANGLYVQRLNSSGTAQWTANGVRIYNTYNSSLKAPLAASGTDTMVLYNSASNSNDVMLQKVASNGAAIFGGGGIGVSATANQEQPNAIVASGDGSGDVIAAYIDFTNYELRINKITNSGTKSWGSGGVQLTTKSSLTSATTYSLDTNSSGDGVTAFLASAGEDDVAFQRSASADGSRQWGSTGVMAGTVGQRAVQFYGWSDSDADGNTFVFVSDYRTLANGYDGYVQKLSSSGSRLWTASGVNLSSSSSDQTPRSVVADGAGGAYFYWADQGDTKAYLQHINSAGSVASGWPAGGLAMSASGVNYNNVFNVVSDGSGGAIVFYGNGGRLYASRVNSSGVKQWGANGVEFSAAGGTPTHDLAVGYGDGAGGAVIAWRHLDGDVPGDYQIRAIMLTSGGAVASGWTTGGTMATNEDTATSPRVVISNSAVFVAWEETPGADADIMMQKFNSSGTVQWTAGGVTVCNATDYQNIAGLVPSGDGAIAVWYDYRSGTNYDIYAQRMEMAGTADWTANGLPVTDASGDQGSGMAAAVASDGAGGVLVLWDDLRNGTNDVYAERLDSSGASKWATDGLMIRTMTGTLVASPASIDTDGNGGAYAVFMSQSSPSNAYAQHVVGTTDATTSNTITMSRLRVGTVSTVAIAFSLTNTLNGTLTVTFPAGFTVLSAATSGSGCLSSFAHTAQTLTAIKTNCSGAISMTGATVENPSTPGAYHVTWVNDDPGGGDVYIVDSDQVTVSAQVNAVITFDIDTDPSPIETAAPYAVPLGAITTANGKVSGTTDGIPFIWLDIATNASAGAVITVSSTNTALKSVSSPGDTIPSSTATQANGTANYGLCSVSTSATSGAMTAVAPFASTCAANSETNAVGGLTTAPQVIYNTAGDPIGAGKGKIAVNAAISAITPAHDDYTDTLKFIATGTF